MENRYKINFDIKRNIATDIKFKQGDDNSAVLEVRLFDGGLPINVEDEVVEFRFKKADGNIVFQDMDHGVSVVSGSLQCVIMGEVLSCPGNVICEIYRSLDTVDLTTPSFNFYVADSLEGGTLSKTYISTIENKLLEWKGTFDELISQLEDIVGTIHAQVNSDWLSEEGVSKILNKPDIFSNYTDGGFLVEDFENVNPIIPVSGNGARVSHTKHSGAFSYDTANGRVSGASQVNTSFTLDVPADGPFSFWYYRTEEMQYMTSWFLLDGAIIQTLDNATEGWVKFERVISAGIHTFTVRNENGYGAGINTVMLIDDMSIPAARVYHQGILEHKDMPPAIGHGGKILALNSDGTAVEYVEVAPQVNADWEAVSGAAEILNKPEIFTISDGLNTIVESFEDVLPVIPRTTTWTRVLDPHTGEYGLCSGHSGYGNNKHLIYELDITLSGILEFWYKTNCEASGMGHYYVKLDGVDLISNNVIVEWTKFATPITVGQHTLDFCAGDNPSWWNEMTIDELSIPKVPTYIQDIFEHGNIPPVAGNGGKLLAINAEATAVKYIDAPEVFSPYSMGFLTEDFEDDTYVIPFYGSGSRVMDDKHSGTFSWKQDGVSDMETVFRIDAPVAGEVAFWYKRTNENDTIVNTQFVLDDTVISDFTGARDWTRFSTQISAGIHTFKIRRTGWNGWWVRLWIDDFSIPAGKVLKPDMPNLDGNGGKLVAVKADSSGWEYVDAPTGGSGGVESFASLTDAPHSYIGKAGKVVKVNTTEDGLEFEDASSGGNIEIIKGNSDGGNPSSTYDDTNIESNALIPVGGTTDQVLAKASASDRDLKWVDVANTMDLLKLKNQTTIPEVTGDDAAIFLKDHKLQVKVASGNVFTLLKLPHTVSLLNFDTDLIDCNPENVWTAFGNAVVSTGQSKFGGKSLHLDGVSGSYVSAPITSGFNFGFEDFTIEWWEYRISAPGDSAILHTGVAASDGGYHGMLLGLVSGGDIICLMTSGTAGNKWDVSGQGSDAGKSMGTVKLNQWVHRAICRENMHYYVFEDGVQKSDWSYGSPIDYNVSYLSLLGVRNNTYANMYIDEFNVINSLAKYTSSFTPPTVPNNIV